jgi:flavodoxin I
MRTMIIYDSQFGNTEIIAQAVYNTLRQQGETDLVRVGQVKLDQLQGIGLLVVGSPTQQFRATEAMRNFLDTIPANGLKGVRVATFDTRLTQAFVDQNKILSVFERMFGYAAERIAKALKQKGGELVLPGEPFYVEGTEGPLVEREEQRAGEWAAKLFA